jgi:hypothetical protein
MPVYIYGIGKTTSLNQNKKATFYSGFSEIKILLFNDLQFVDEILCITEFVHHPQYIAYINIDRPVQVFVESDLMAQCLIIAVER